MKRETRGRGGGGQHAKESRKPRMEERLKKEKQHDEQAERERAYCERREGEQEKQGAA